MTHVETLAVHGAGWCGCIASAASAGGSPSGRASATSSGRRPKTGRHFFPFFFGFLFCQSTALNGRIDQKGSTAARRSSSSAITFPKAFKLSHKTPHSMRLQLHYAPPPLPRCTIDMRGAINWMPARWIASLTLIPRFITATRNER